LLETDASDFAIAGILSQKFEDGKLHPIGFASRKLNPAELNYDVYNKEMLAVVYYFKFWRHFLEGAEIKTRVLSDHQNLVYFKTAVTLNRRQARLVEDHKPYNFEILYRKGTANVKADTLSRCPAFTSKEGGSTSALSNTTMFNKERWMEIGTLEVQGENIEEYEVIEIGGIEVELLLPEAKERIKQKALLDDKYLEIARKVGKDQHLDRHFTIENDLLCWKKRVYVPEKLRQKKIESEHDSQVTGHFGRVRTLELVSRNFYWVNMERDVRKYCQECDNCQRVKSP